MIHLIPFAAIAAILFTALVGAQFFRSQFRRKRLAAWPNRKQDRFPGQRRLWRLYELQLEITILVGFLLAVPLAIYAAYISALYIGKRTGTNVEFSLVLAIAVIFFACTLVNLRKRLREKRDLHLEYEGVAIVGQALSRMVQDGYRVYHDFPVQDVTIDHVVLGDKGLFVVETRARSKRTISDRREDATVEYDGRALHFPSGTEIEMIDQARQRAQWLGQWLTQALGDDILVRAVIALPGWLVRRTSSKGLPIVNPQQFDSLFEHIQPQPLSAKLIGRIADQLDRKCRNVAPVT